MRESRRRRLQTYSARWRQRAYRAVASRRTLSDSAITVLVLPGMSYNPKCNLEAALEDCKGVGEFGIGQDAGGKEEADAGRVVAAVIKDQARVETSADELARAVECAVTDAKREHRADAIDLRNNAGMLAAEPLEMLARQTLQLFLAPLGAEHPLAREFFDDADRDRHRHRCARERPGDQSRVEREALAQQHGAALENLADRDDVNVIGEVEQVGREQFRASRERLYLVGPYCDSSAAAFLEHRHEELARSGDKTR